MPSSNDNEKVNKLFKEYLDEISSDKNAEEYLESEGLNPTDLINDAIRKIKQLNMQKASAATESSYLSLTTNLMARAKEQANRIMQTSSFDIVSFIKTQGITVAYRNFESMSKDEIREFLEKHILLKLQEQNDNKKNNE